MSLPALSRSNSFAPATDSITRLLVLGSLPGTASLRQQQYYAHPQNQFWRLMGAVLDADLVAVPYDTRLTTMQAAGVGLWDVVSSAARSGSLDSAIRDVEANDLMALVTGLPALQAVAFNGATAHRIGTRLLADAGTALIALPSSSPAHAAMSFEAKRAVWVTLRAYL